MENLLWAIFVPTIVFLVVVAPIWLVLHYRSKNNAASALSAAETAELEALAARAEQMEERIRTLEAILDDEAPAWRERAS